MEFEIFKMKDIKKVLLKYLFPSFQNKITWVVVIGGLSLVSSPLLEQVLKLIINSNFDLNITDGNDSVIGLCLVSIGLIYHYGNERSFSNNKELSYDKTKQNFNHDKGVYDSLYHLFKEGELKSHVESILDYHSYDASEDNDFLYFYHNGEKIEHQFLNPLINDKKNKLHESLRYFTQFKYKNFSLNREGYDRRYLFPQGNIDLRSHVSKDDDQKYDRLTLELNALGDKVMLDCDDYRMSIKRELGI